MQGIDETGDEETDKFLSLLKPHLEGHCVVIQWTHYKDFACNETCSESNAAAAFCHPALVSDGPRAVRVYNFDRGIQGLLQAVQ